jgi:leucyl aminopeptidase
MRISAAVGKAVQVEADLLALGIPAEAKTLKGVAAEIDEAMGGAVSEMLRSGADFTGKTGEKALLRPAMGIAAGCLLIVGLGESRRIDAEALRVMGGATVREAISLKAASVALLMPSSLPRRLGVQEAAEALAEGAGLGGYLFEQYRSGERKQGPEAVTVVCPDGKTSRLAKAGAEAGAIIAESVAVARDLGNHPANVATPAMLAEQARKLAKAHGFKVEVLGPSEIDKLGMGGIKAVAAGSDQPPRVIVMRHSGGRRGSRNPVVLVGKGLTFDSGGICIKPADGMDRMKTDMAAGAAVIGAMAGIARLKLPVDVIGIVPSTENMGGGSAFRPGDVLKAYDGQTIEVISTDAEGRLILADALAYAKELKPAAVVDMATLTGACVIAIGHHASGLMGTDNSLMSRIEKAGAATNERVWRFPLWDEYFEQIKSDIADMKNTGGRPAGAITAACLLSKFAAGVPWAHVDIAGTAWADKEKPYVPKAATGVGVRLLIELLRRWPRTG